HASVTTGTLCHVPGLRSQVATANPVLHLRPGTRDLRPSEPEPRQPRLLRCAASPPTPPQQGCRKTPPPAPYPSPAATSSDWRWRRRRRTCPTRSTAPIPPRGGSSV